MPEIVTVLLWLITIPPALLLLVFSFEVWLGIGRTNARAVGDHTPDTCILIPAHNEAMIISETLDHLRAVLAGDVKVLVVADNCTDETASLVRSHGFEVVERFDADARGKGFALAFGREHIRTSPPQCVIVLDADCRSDTRSIFDLARCSYSENSAVQASYVFEPGHHASAKVQVSNFALWIKNVVRQRGSRRAGGAAILTGTGMAFPWEIFERMPLATGSIVEDLSLTVDLVRSGEAPLFLEQAKVVSAAASQQATLGQRSRWEQGFLAVASSHAIPLLRHALASLDRKAILLGLHLLVPPLTLLLFLCGLITAILGGVAVVTGLFHPFAVLLVLLLAALMGVLINWLMEGRFWLTPKALVTLPLYMLWKLPVYGRFLIGRRVGWVRTERD